ncbi:MAG TPA: hypothetical protein VNG51_24785 [Ktedonobacteraceae bacterium]|nr:hypothetical protein [Ktedonobacteraceae bacterium]
MSDVIAQIDPTVPLDMVRGVYCSPMYPALSMDDHYPPPSPQPPAYPEYPAPNATPVPGRAGQEHHSQHRLLAPLPPVSSKDSRYLTR